MDSQLDVRLCAVDELAPGLGQEFQVGEHRIAVFRTRAGRVFAVDARCPHRGGVLADGMLAGERVVCPFHSFRYDLGSGECDQRHGCALKRYDCEVHDGWITVKLPADTAELSAAA